MIHTISYWKAWYHTIAQYQYLTRPTMKEVWQLIQDLEEAST